MLDVLGVYGIDQRSQPSRRRRQSDGVVALDETTKDED